MSFEEQLTSLDVDLLASIETETSDEDKRSLLALHLACRRRHPEFRWLEVGSHLGGSLQSLVRDPACTAIESIDPRPEELPDERFGAITYPGNSTARMLELLGDLPDAEVSKMRTHDTTTGELDPTAIQQPQVCFIDGEHTDESCAQDAEFCRAALRDVGLIAFHDVWIVYGAVAAFVQSLQDAAIAHSIAYLPDSIFVVELGPRELLSDPAVTGRQLVNGAGVLRMLKLNDHYRAVLKGRRARALRRLGLLRIDEPSLS